MSHGCNPGHCRHSSPCSSPTAGHRRIIHSCPNPSRAERARGLCHRHTRSHLVPHRRKGRQETFARRHREPGPPEQNTGLLLKGIAAWLERSSGCSPEGDSNHPQHGHNIHPNTHPFPKGEEDPRRRAGLRLAATAASGAEVSHTCPQRGFRSRRLGTDCRHGLGLQGHAMQREFVVFHRSRAGGHLPGGCRSILSGRPAEAAAKGPGHFRTMTRGVRMTWQTGSQE